MATLQTVIIPGYAEAIKRETKLRDTAFLDGRELVCGVEVFPLSLRRLIWLEQARNGFVVPCRFDSEAEMLAHALQCVYFCLPEFAPPVSPRFSFWRVFQDGVSQRVFFRKVLRAGSPDVIIKEVESWLREAFMDAGGSGGGKGEVPCQSYASYPAYIVDAFAAAGLPFTYAEVMDMPLRRLWQHWRVAMRRLHGVALTNPSDLLAVEHLAHHGHRN
jgi:hypothetical protein